MAKLDACPTEVQEVVGLTQPCILWIDHELLSTVILSLLMIQKGQLSVSGPIMCTILVNRLED